MKKLKILLTNDAMVDSIDLFILEDDEQLFGVNNDVVILVDRKTGSEIFVKQKYILGFVISNT